MEKALDRLERKEAEKVKKEMDSLLVLFQKWNHHKRPLRQNMISGIKEASRIMKYVSTAESVPPKLKLLGSVAAIVIDTCVDAIKTTSDQIQQDEKEELRAEIDSQGNIY